MSAPAATPVRNLGTMPPHARVWVYKTARTLSVEEVMEVRTKGAAFTSGWAAHGAALDACVDVLHGHFIVIALDEAQARASGCGIDKSVAFVRSLEEDLGRPLTDRMVLVYEHDGALHATRLPELPALIMNGRLTDDTIVYDDLVATVGDLRDRFRVPLKDSWVARYR